MTLFQEGNTVSNNRIIFLVALNSHEMYNFRIKVRNVQIKWSIGVIISQVYKWLSKAYGKNRTFKSYGSAASE